MVADCTPRIGRWRAPTTIEMSWTEYRERFGADPDELEMTLGDLDRMAGEEGEADWREFNDWIKP